MNILAGVQNTFSSSFGPSRTGATVTCAVLDSGGNVVGSGFTMGSVIELGGGYYGVAITFNTPFSGYIKWTDMTDGITLMDTITVNSNDAETLRKIETNRWKINNNQLTVYDDDGTTPLLIWNLFDDGVANGDTPNERVPA